MRRALMQQGETYLQFAGLTVLNSHNSLPSHKSTPLQQALPGPLSPCFLDPVPGCGHPHSPPANHGPLLWKVYLPPLPELPQLCCSVAGGSLQG